MSVFDPTTGNSNTKDTEVTVGQVMVQEGEIVEAITVTEVTTFRPNTANQTPTDSALTYSEE